MRFYNSLSVRWLPHITVACVLGTFVVQGCGKGTPVPTGEQASVTGNVLLDGKPVAPDTSIVFYCKDKDATAAGKVDSAGTFSLKAAQPAIGIPVGQYVVMVRPPEPPLPTSAAAGPSSPDYQKAMKEGGAAKKPTTSTEIPEAFLTLNTSKLALELKAGPNTFNIDLAKVGK